MVVCGVDFGSVLVVRAVVVFGRWCCEIVIWARLAGFWEGVQFFEVKLTPLTHARKTGKKLYWLNWGATPTR